MPSKIHLRKEIGAMDMKYQSLESLPLALSVDDLMDILNVGKNTA